MFQKKTARNLQIQNSVNIGMASVGFYEAEIGDIKITAEIKGNFKVCIEVFWSNAVFQKRNVFIIKAEMTAVRFIGITD